MQTMARPAHRRQDKDRDISADGTGRKMNRPATTGAEDKAKGDKPMRLVLVFPPETTTRWIQAQRSAKPSLRRIKKSIARKVDATNAANKDTSHATVRSAKAAKDKPEYDPHGLRNHKRVLT